MKVVRVAHCLLRSVQGWADASFTALRYDFAPLIPRLPFFVTVVPVNQQVTAFLRCALGLAISDARPSSSGTIPSESWLSRGKGVRVA